MKNFFPITVLLLLNSLFLSAQDYKNGKIALYFFSVSSNETLALQFSKAQFDSIYNDISSILVDSGGLQLQSRDFLQGKVNYNIFDFPMSTAKKATKSNMADFYMRIDLFIENSGVATSKSDEVTISGIGKGKESMKTKVKATIKIDIVDKNGEEVFSKKVKQETKDKLVINSESFVLGSFSMKSYDKNQYNEASVLELIMKTTLEMAKLF